MKQNKKRWSMSGFVDWNEYSMDELALYLEKTIENEAKEDTLKIQKLLKFYNNKENGTNEELNVITGELLNKYRWLSSGLAFSICRMIDYYNDQKNK